MVSVVLLELTTEHTVRKPEACSPLRASPSLEHTEEENLTEYRRFAAYGISQKESVYGIRDANFFGISVRFSSLYATKRFIRVFFRNFF